MGRRQMSRAAVAAVLLLASVAVLASALDVRRNFLQMSSADQQAWMKAVNLLKEERDANGTRTYDKYTIIHKTYAQFAHMGPGELQLSLCFEVPHGACRVQPSSLGTGSFCATSSWI